MSEQVLTHSQRALVETWEQHMAAEFDTRTPHWMGAADGTTVELLHLSGPEGQRIHLPELDA